MAVIIFLSVASINSGATMYRFDSSAESGGNPELETEAADAGAADGAVAGAAVCERVCLDVACRLAGRNEP
eukprot:5085991-Pleurochrysis_carterae.AAC.1